MKELILYCQLAMLFLILLSIIFSNIEITNLLEQQISIQEYYYNE